jgi:molybdate transport system regulatory protein
MTHRPGQPTLSLRIRFGGNDMIGPGKAELLERIVSSGSIAAAAREMGMSYKRAWMLIETLNAMFDQPLVETARGGPGKGGAVLTARGLAVLAQYRAVEAIATQQAQGRLSVLGSWLRKAEVPGGKED